MKLPHTTGAALTSPARLLARLLFAFRPSGFAAPNNHWVTQA